MLNNFLKKNRGFTLIELMVAVSIFAIVMVISMGAILTVVDGNKKNQNMQVAINNLNYAVDSMTRTMKTGYNYAVDATGDIPCNDAISLTTTDDQDVSYYRRQYPDSDNYGLFFQTLTGSSYEGFITAPDLHITKLCFEEASAGQPSLTIVIQGETTGGKEGTQTQFDLYTSVTQRQVQYD